MPEVLCLLENDWKYLYWPEGEVEQLFDLSSDPYETNNKAQDSPERRKAMRDQLLEELKQRGAKCVEDGELPTKEIEEHEVRELRSQFWAGYHTEHFGIDVRH